MKTMQNAFVSGTVRIAGLMRLSRHDLFTNPFFRVLKVKST
jgi:hypothetical protein